MARTSNVFARVEPDVKMKAEAVLNELGIPMSNAIGIFLKQVILQGGLPFDVKIPASIPVSFNALTKEQFDAQMESAFAAYQRGDYQTAPKAFADLEQELGL